MDASEFMTVEEVAARFGVAARTVRQWAATDRVPAVKIGRGYLRFRREVIDRLAAGKEPAGEHPQT